MRMENRETMETTSKVGAGGRMRRAVLPAFLRGRGGQRAARMAAGALLAGAWLLGGTGTASAAGAIYELSDKPNENVATIKDGKVVINDADFPLVDIEGHSHDALMRDDSIYVTSRKTKGDTAYNMGTFSGESELLMLFAGYTDSGDAHHNSIIVKGGKISSVTAGNTESGSACNNRVVFSGGELTEARGGFSGSCAGYGTVEVHDNSFEVTGGKVYQAVYAGLSNKSAKVYDNTLNISGGEFFHKVLGGGTSASGEADENKVNISGSAIIHDDVVGGMSWEGTASGNIVSISGGTVKSDSAERIATIYGGYSGKGTADNNTIEISGTPDLREASLYGCNDQGSGNQLKLHADSAVQVKSVKNFDAITFGNVGANGAALAVDGGDVILPESWELKLASEVQVVPKDTSTVVSTEDEVVLFDASAAETVTNLDSFKAPEGSSVYRYTLAALENVKDSGVTVTGGLSSPSISSDGRKIICSATDIDTITYGTLKWETDGTVISLDASKNYDLSKTTVDTENIGFTADSLATIKKQGSYGMTLLDTKGNTSLAAANLKAKNVEFPIGTALKAKGVASLTVAGNVVYTIDAKAGLSETDQPHAAAMAASAGAAAVTSSAATSVDTAMGVLASAPAGSTTGFAGFGAGTNKYKTGSDVQSNMWQGTFGAGTKKELKDGASLDWGVIRGMRQRQLHNP